jgi:hypothetical protein
MGILFKCGNGDDTSAKETRISYQKLILFKLQLAKIFKILITNSHDDDDDLSLQDYYKIFKTYEKKKEKKFECKGILYLLEKSNTFGVFKYSQCNYILDMIHQIYRYDNIHLLLTEENFLLSFIQLLEYSVIHHKNLYMN